MKAKVRLTRTVELFVEGETEDDIMDWLVGITPEEAYLIADGNAEEEYKDEIVYFVREDSVVDYVIR